MEEICFVLHEEDKGDLRFLKHLRDRLGSRCDLQQVRSDTGTLLDSLATSCAAPRGEEGEIQSEREKAMSCLAKAEDGQLELLTLLTSVDMVCFTSPCLASGRKGVTLYHNKSTSDVPNERAMRSGRR